MKPIVCLIVTTAMGLVLSTQSASAASSQLQTQCPSAYAWHESHKALSSSQKRKLELIRPADPALAAQLATRYARDQAAEHAVINGHVFSEPPAEQAKSAALKHLLAIQKADLDWFKPVVDAHGFPAIQQVGLKGVEHAWMLVQHADADPAFQAKVLADLKPQLSTEPFLKNDYALLFDRVRTAQHKKQVYGTQFGSKNGRLVMDPTEDVTQLDTRRAAMDLMPIADYRCVLETVYHMRGSAGPRPSASTSK